MGVQPVPRLGNEIKKDFFRIVGGSFRQGRMLRKHLFEKAIARMPLLPNPEIPIFEIQ